MNQPNPSFECSECGLHYSDKTVAEACEKFCSQHQACNMEITQQSVEVKAAKL